MASRARSLDVRRWSPAGRCRDRAGPESTWERGETIPVLEHDMALFGFSLYSNDQGLLAHRMKDIVSDAELWQYAARFAGQALRGSFIIVRDDAGYIIARVGVATARRLAQMCKIDAHGNRVTFKVNVAAS
jgi:hypothetical protein